MRDESTRRRRTGPQETNWTAERVQVGDWRRHCRLDDLRALDEGADGLALSRGLLHPLLEEKESFCLFAPPRGHRVRELVCDYRPPRDSDGRVVDVPTVLLKDTRTAAIVLASLIVNQTVEVFGVACLSMKHRLLACHALGGPRPAHQSPCRTCSCLGVSHRGATGAMAVHNRPSGNRAFESRRRAAACGSPAASVLDLSMLDHLIVGDEHRCVSFREAGLMERLAQAADCHVWRRLRRADSVEVLGRVKASLAALAAGAALTQPPHFTRRASIEAAGNLEERVPGDLRAASGNR